MTLLYGLRKFLAHHHHLYNLTESFLTLVFGLIGVLVLVGCALACHAYVLRRNRELSPAIVPIKRQKFNAPPLINRGHSRSKTSKMSRKERDDAFVIDFDVPMRDIGESNKKRNGSDDGVMVSYVVEYDVPLMKTETGLLGISRTAQSQKPVDSGWKYSDETLHSLRMSSETLTDFQMIYRPRDLDSTVMIPIISPGPNSDYSGYPEKRKEETRYAAPSWSVVTAKPRLHHYRAKTLNENYLTSNRISHPQFQPPKHIRARSLPSIPPGLQAPGDVGRVSRAALPRPPAATFSASFLNPNYRRSRLTSIEERSEPAPGTPSLQAVENPVSDVDLAEFVVSPIIALDIMDD